MKQHPSPSALAAVLLPEYRRRVLGLLLLQPDEALHGREVARRTGLPAGTITRELNKLAEAGLLRRERRGNQQLYSADTGCPVFHEVAGLLRKTSGWAERLARALEPVEAALKVAFVFGSMAQGSATRGSDIDVMLIGEGLSFAQAVELFYPLQEELGREVNPRVYSQAEFAAKVAEEPYLRDVLAKPKLFLIGGEDDLAELARPHA